MEKTTKVERTKNTLPTLVYTLAAGDREVKKKKKKADTTTTAKRTVTLKGATYRIQQDKEGILERWMQLSRLLLDAEFDPLDPESTTRLS